MNTVFELVDPDYCSIGLYSWSEYIRVELIDLTDELALIPTSIENRLYGEPYGESYITAKCFQASTRLSNVVAVISEELFFLDPKTGIMLFSDMIFEDFTHNHLHALLSLVSDNLNKNLRGASVSLHSPIKTYEIDSGFPVHADLFKSRALFNIISENNDIDAGQVLLIPIDALYRAMTNTAEMPAGVVEFIINLLLNRVDQDCFDMLFDLMHGEHVWSKSLERNINNEILLLPVRSGDGYFLIDGKWLHGRAPVKGAVKESRLQRLTFDTRASLEMPNFKLSIPPEVMAHLADRSGDELQKYKSIKAMPNKANALGRQKAPLVPRSAFCRR